MTYAHQTARVIPCLWFNDQGEDAANFYVSLLPDSRIDHITRAPDDYPGGKAGQALEIQFTLAGQPYSALNGGPYFTFTEAISIQVICDDQDELDRLYAALSVVPEAEQCGWLKDKYGLSWQLIPRDMPAMLSDPDPARARRVFHAMMNMKRLDIAALEAAYED